MCNSKRPLVFPILTHLTLVLNLDTAVQKSLLQSSEKMVPFMIFKRIKPELYTKAVSMCSFLIKLTGNDNSNKIMAFGCNKLPQLTLTMFNFHSYRNTTLHRQSIYRVLHFKQNSWRSPHHSRRPNTSVVAIAYYMKREELHFTAGNRPLHSRRDRRSPA